MSRIPAKEIERNRDEPGEDGKYISDSAGKGRFETIRRQKSPLRSPTECLPTHPTRRSASRQEASHEIRIGE